MTQKLLKFHVLVFTAILRIDEIERQAFNNRYQKSSVSHSRRQSEYYVLVEPALCNIQAWTGHCAMAQARPPSSTNTGAPFEKMKCFEGLAPGNVVKCIVYL